MTQHRRNVLVLVLTLAALVVAVVQLSAQTPTTRIVQLAPRVADEFARSYDPHQEQVWRVTGWDSTSRGDYTLITVLAVEYVATGEPNKIASHDVAKLANDPSIHFHAIGNCQASPADREASATRHAAFDGILCGDRFAVWYFADEIIAAQNYNFLLAQQASR